MSAEVWQLWKNPIFLRYCRSCLRLQGLGMGLLVSVLIAGFMVALAASIGSHDPDKTDVARYALIPLLVLQGFILLILGTAQVAGGMTAERDEEVIDYQRLLPMSPLAKVLGYLFGLPIREYVLFGATLPFVGWCLWKGQVPWGAWLPLYVAVFSSTLLHHFTGLIAGTVVSNRRWAFLVSIGLVFALYTVIPQMARFGLVFFNYLTIRPVFDEALPCLLTSGAGAAVKAVRLFAPTAKFFNLDLPQIVFTLFSQGGLILTFAVMLCRKWRRSEAHLLGKGWALMFFVWLQIVLLGNALPLIDSGKIFPTHVVRAVTSWSPKTNEAVMMSGVYGVVSLLFIYVLAGMITPSRQVQVCGWRRARKLGRTRLERGSDAVTSFWHVFAMACVGAFGWFIFSKAVVESRWFPGHTVPWFALLGFGVAMVTGAVAMQALLEAEGGKKLGLAVILIGVVPLMVGTVSGIASSRLLGVACWVANASPLCAPLSAAGSQLSVAELPMQMLRAVPRAFVFWQTVWMLCAGWLAMRLRGARKRSAESR